MPEGQESARAGAALSRLSCVTCRARKLKCDRTIPVCARCSKVDNECIYPNSRKKRIFQRKDMKALEARLAQLEDQLNEVTNCQESTDNSGIYDELDLQPPDLDDTIDLLNQHDAGHELDTQEFQSPILPDKLPGSSSNIFGGQLIDLGLLESLPPSEVIEELHNIYFQNQHHSMPIIHPGRYLQAMYGPPAKKPPMCLQYILWATASKGNEKYDFYADAFYMRARQYADVDDMKGDGNHLTVRHLQTYVIMAGYEAKSMLFTRASMNSARCVRLVHSMGLDQIDDPEASPTSTTGSWVETEQLRRGFWGAFAIDSHASISTGWASLIRSKDIMTRLPASEDAFLSGTEEEAPFLEEVFQGASYSNFATTLVICHIFKTVLSHTSKRSHGRADDLKESAFWKRHKGLDHKISSTFLFLPDKFRLPGYRCDPVAAHTNLNLHASAICLHHAAVDMIDKHADPNPFKELSLGRMRISAEEIVEIVKVIPNHSMIYKSVLSALSLYCAASVYIYLAKDNPTMGLESSDMANFKTIIHSMRVTGREHKISRALLAQVYGEVERNGLSSIFHLPTIGQGEIFANYPCPHVLMSVKIALAKQAIFTPLQLGMLRLGSVDAHSDPTSLPHSYLGGSNHAPTESRSDNTLRDDSIGIPRLLDDFSTPLWPQSDNEVSSRMWESMQNNNIFPNDSSDLRIGTTTFLEKDMM